MRSYRSSTLKNWFLCATVVLAVRGHASDLLRPTGALDPSVRDNSAPRPIQPAAVKAPLDPVISENVIAHSRELCPNGRGLQQNETAIAAAGNVVVVAFNDARGAASACPDDHAAAGWGYSLDGGATFTDGGALPHPRDFNNGDPWLGVSPDGQTFYFSGLWRGFAGLGFLRGRAIEGGFVWDEPVIISFPSTDAFMDKEAFVVDPNNGTIYLTYTDFRAPTGIKLTRSFDGGDTWLDPVMVNPGGQGSFPAVDNQGVLYVAYNASGAIAVSQSLDGGDTFQRVATFPIRTQGVSFMDRSPSFPQVAIDLTRGTRDGWAYVVWQMLDDQNVLRPYITHSEDGGASWTTPIPMDSDVDTTAFHWWPSVSVDSTGNVNAIWLDRRLNPGTGLTDTFFAQSTDGGNTFTDLRMSDVSGNWQGILFDGGFTFAGDYVRAVSVGTSVYAAWVDARNGDPDIYFARVDAAAMAGRKH